MYVNCWQHRSLYSVLQAITDDLKILGAEAQNTNVKLVRIRQALRGRPFVVILDEIDRPIPAQREEIIYGLLGLPRGALACVANGTQVLATMDERVRSRLSPMVIQLSPYSAILARPTGPVAFRRRVHASPGAHFAHLTSTRST